MGCPGALGGITNLRGMKKNWRSYFGEVWMARPAWGIASVEQGYLVPGRLLPIELSWNLQVKNAANVLFVLRGDKMPNSTEDGMFVAPVTKILAV